MPVMRLQLAQNIPNPFNPSTTVVFTVPGIAGSKVPATLAVYDLSGRKVRTLVSGPLSPGEHVLVWNGDDEAGATVSSGTYFAVLRCAGEQRSMKMSLLK
jgi:flagellar hook assembly protein FlgD